MIISDKYRFAFIHIPKCAGTTIKKTLIPYDDLLGAHTDRVASHPVFGMMDYVHIPLFIMKDYFKVEYQKVAEYDSFAVVRNPFSRFPSSVSQYVRMYTDKEIRTISKRDMIKYTDRIIDFLISRRSEDLLPFDFIHFQKQYDFIYCQDGKIVKYLYKLENIEMFFVHVSRIVGRDLLAAHRGGSRKENYTELFRSRIFQLIVGAIKPVLDKPATILLPKSTRDYVHNFLYKPRDEKMKSIFSSYEVKSFIESYYLEDIKIFNSLEI